MKSARNHAILSRVSRHVARSIFANCEPLEVRRLLDGDPVIVLTEPVADSLASALEDYLWNNLQEEPFDPPITGTPDTMDGGDSNTLPGDRHGWNFATDSANFTPDTTLNAHGTAVSSYVLEVLANAPDGLGENVKIMYVIPDGDKLNGESDALDYILAHENAGINIVAGDRNGDATN